MTWRRLRKILQETSDSMLDEEVVVYDEARNVVFTTVSIGSIDGDLAERFNLIEDFPFIAVDDYINCGCPEGECDSCLKAKVEHNRYY